VWVFLRTPQEEAVGEKILFVDDEASVLEAFQRMLHSSFDIRTASCGGEGLIALEREGPFGVIISDMRMPGMSGAEFLARARQKAPDSVRMLLTGHAEVRAAIDAVNRGQILHFLTKPCSKAVLVDAINSGLEQYHAAIEQRELSEQARSFKRAQIDHSAVESSDWDKFKSPVGLRGPVDAKTYLEPLIGKDAHVYTAVLRLPLLDTVEQRYGQAATTEYLRHVTGMIQKGLAAGDRLFHWRQAMFLAVLTRHISSAAVLRELERDFGDGPGCVIEAHGRPAIVSRLITYEIVSASGYSGFLDWLAAFEGLCDGRAVER
jgi:FixJ family two-component response regulator